jgi:hypothetical protein
MMAKKSKKQHDDQFVDLPEDRIGQISKAEPQEKTEKNSQPKRLTPRKARQVQDAALSEPKVSEDGPKTVSDTPIPSKEDLLADIRQELASEEEIIEQKGLFSRFKGRLKNLSKTKTKDVEFQSQLEGGVPAQEGLQVLAVEPKSKKKRRSNTKQEELAIQEFFSDLEALTDMVPDEGIPEAVEIQEFQLEEEKPFETVKTPRLPVKSDDKYDIDFGKVREVALQEYDGTLVEPVVERKISLQEEVRKTIRESKPFERVLIVAVFLLTVGALLFSGIYIIVNSISFPTPEPTIAVDLDDIVYPTHLSLPGGWGFNLGQGRVDEGQWSPQGAEWLMGTEISRWVALPWSLQLEAVLRTLKSGDHIELTMSNLDRLEYNVYSIQEMTMEEIQAHDAKTPSLLIILFEEEGNSNTHWVVTALP